ncbi:MAG: membrane protein [Alphaproteobacteria bacterium]|nr:MAG: membrane protein [Alphaproteobacteria bacterium]
MSDHKTSSLARLRNYFLTGFIITAPLVITVYLIWTFVQWVDSWVIPYIPAVYNPETYLPFDIPGVGLVIAIVTITLIGFLTANIIGRSVVNYGETLLGRMPLVRSIYNGLKQIFETVFSGDGASFQKVGLIEYPRPGLWALVFVATEARGEVKARLADSEVEAYAVFLPTTPNPTSGFLLFVPRPDIVLLEMGVEDAAKLIISAGLVTPKYQETLATLAAEAQQADKVAPARRKRKPVKSE